MYNWFIFFKQCNSILKFCPIVIVIPTHRRACRSLPKPNRCFNTPPQGLCVPSAAVCSSNSHFLINSAQDTYYCWMLDIEEVDEHINYDSAAAELAFTKGVSRRGRAYLDEVSQSIVRDPDLTTREKNAIRAAFDNLSEVVADGKGESYSQVTLKELDVYGLSDHLIEKIGFLVFDRENNIDRSPPLHRSPRTSGGGNGGRNKRESVESGIQSQISMDEEYEDDFETSDETYSTYSDKERRQSGLQSQVGRVSPTYYQHTQQQQQVFSSKQNRENRVRGGERQEIGQNYVREPDLYGDTGIAVSNGSDGGVVGTGLCGPNPFQNILQGTPSSYNGGTGAGQEYIPNVMSRSVDLEKDSSDSDDDYGDASYEGEYSDSDYYYSEEEEDYGDNDDAEREYADDFGDNSLASEAVGNVTEQSPIKGIAPSTSVGNVHDGTPNDSLLSANVSPLKQSEPDKKNNGKRRRRRKKKNPSWIDKQRWTRGEKIGSGSFGDVYQGRYMLSFVFVYSSGTAMMMMTTIMVMMMAMMSILTSATLLCFLALSISYNTPPLNHYTISATIRRYE
jgi:hypothetical protein